MKRVAERTGDDETVRARSVRPGQDVWELYYLPDDFSQAKNLAADQPQKLAELKELFWQEAERNRVLPLVGGMGEQPAAMSATPMWPRLLFRPPCRPLSLRASIASTSVPRRQSTPRR